MGTWEDPEECLNGVPLKHTSRDHCAGWGRLVRYPQPFFPYAGGGGSQRCHLGALCNTTGVSCSPARTGVPCAEAGGCSPTL